MAREVTKVLVVDDDPLVRILVRDQLEHLGHPVAIAASCPEALERVEGDTAIGLIFINLWMLGLDGDALLEAVRDGRPGLRMVGMADDRASGSRDLGPSPILVKPYTLGQLRDALGRLSATRDDGRLAARSAPAPAG